MDFLGLAEQNHNQIATNIFKIKKLLHAHVNEILNFLQKITSGAKNFLLLPENFGEKQFYV